MAKCRPTQGQRIESGKEFRCGMTQSHLSPQQTMILKEMVVHFTDEKTEALKDLFAVTSLTKLRSPMSYKMGKS